jgi:hypothetical protein
MRGAGVFEARSVFGYYPRGDKGALVTTFYAQVRDRNADEIAFGGNFSGGGFPASAFVETRAIASPEQAIDALADALLAAPLEPGTRDTLIRYMGGQVTEEKVRGAAWLVLCSPEFQVN